MPYGWSWTGLCLCQIRSHPASACPGEQGSQTIALRVSHHVDQKSSVQVSGMSSEVCLLGLLKMLQAMSNSHPTQLVMKTGDLSTEEEEQQGAPIGKKGMLQWAPGHPLTAPHSPSFLTLPNITDHRTQSHILFLFHLFLLYFYATLSSAMVRLPVFLGCKYIEKEIVNKKI